MSIRNHCLAVIAGAAIATTPLLSTSVAAQDLVTDEMLLTAQEDPNNWPMAIGNYTGNRFSKLSQINTSNVKKLVPKWIFSLGTLDAQNTTPVIYNGVMYATASHGRTYAIDAANGREIWRYVHQLPEEVGGHMCCDIGNRGIAIYGDKVFVATPDAHVVALDMKTGEVVWDKTLGKWEHAYTMTVAPLVVKGKVVRMESFGAFVDLGHGIEGMVHVSNISHRRVGRPDEILRIAQEVEVQILEIKEGGKRIGLGMKQLEPDPWDEVQDRFNVDAVFTGKVRRLAEFGAFVELVPGVEGLLHVSQFGEGRIRHAKDVLKDGQEITVRISKLDVPARRVSLSRFDTRGILLGSDEAADGGLIDEVLSEGSNQSFGNNLGAIFKKALDKDG